MGNFLLAAINEVAFSIGKIEVRWYGIIVTSAIVAAFVLYLWLGKKRGIDTDFGLELFIWVVVLAVLFCRIFYVVPRKEFWPTPFDWDAFKNLFDITKGGLTIIGGIFGGALGVLLCCLRNRKYSFARVADCVVIALLLGQIIGRWGNFFNQELFGLRIDNPAMQYFPLAVHIDRWDYPEGWYCALFFYEGFINTLGLAGALWLFLKKGDKIKPFGISLLYLAWYGLVRGSLEFLKFEHATFPGTEIGMVQVICYVMCAVCLALFVLLQKGLIRFETKWFQGVVERRRAALEAKAAVNAAASDGQSAERTQYSDNAEDAQTASTGVEVSDKSSAADGEDNAEEKPAERSDE